jgi:hypothetical protein
MLAASLTASDPTAALNYVKDRLCETKKPSRNVPVAVPVESAYRGNMSGPLSRMVTFTFAVLVLGADATASARPKRQPSAERTLTQITTCDGTPIIMQGMDTEESRQLRARNAPGSPREAAAVLTSRHFNAHHRWRCPSRRRLLTFRRLSTTPASRSSNLMSLFHLTGAWGTIPQIATTTYATISPDNGSCRSYRADRSLQLMARICRSGTSAHGSLSDDKWTTFARCELLSVWTGSGPR